MKHLFFVHSHITFLVSREYLLQKQISPDSCVFICCRNYHIPSVFHHIFKYSYSYPNEFLDGKAKRLFQGVRVLKTISLLRKFDNKISYLTDNSYFNFYLPNAVTADFASAIVSMKLCSHYFYIEEGSGSYLPDKELPAFKGNLIRKSLKLILPRLYCIRQTCFYHSNNKYAGTICTTDNCFPGMPGSKLIVPNIFYKQFLPIVPNTIISIDGSLLAFFNEDVFKKLLSDIRNNFEVGRVAYKFHPLFYSDECLMNDYRNVILNTFGDDAIEIPSDCILENILYTYPSITFISDYSSVAIYSKRFGVNCISCCKWLFKYDTKGTYKAHVKKCPDIIRSSYSNFTDFDSEL